MASESSQPSSGSYHSMAIHDAILQPEINLGVVEKVVGANPESLRAVNVVTGLTPLQAAARRSHSRLIRLLVARGASLEDRAQNGETPFLIACQVCDHPHVGCSVQICCACFSILIFSHFLSLSHSLTYSLSLSLSLSCHRMVVCMQFML